ncbi:GlxA family transcriptional regulator [Neoroseomonas terrae]|nr:GlxA family transcriptional regulator [Neoroseomonas terrae]
MSFSLDDPTLPRQHLAGMPNAPRSSPTGCRAVEILTFPAAQLLDVCGPLQVLASANQMATEQGNEPTYSARVVAPSGGVVATSAGLGLVAAPLPSPHHPVDTLLVTGGPGVHAAAADPDLVGWLQARARDARRVASVCTGAFLLGAAGLLDGRRAATHWRWCTELAQRFPAVRVEADPIFVRDGSVWSSAGVTAGIDLVLAMVEEDLGRATALEVARRLVMFLKRPGGQAQFSVTLSLQSGDRFDALHRWMEQNLGSDLSLAILSREAGMSQRSFSRHYAEATGLTPARAVERLRVETASRLLIETGLPTKRIAQRCGFGSEETMRRSFFRLLTTTPQEYRARFGA